MIDGLKLTVTGDELRTLLKARAAEHRASAERWEREAERTPDQQTEEAPLMPEHICENEGERHEWRAEVLEFMRDHLEPLEIYRLGESDLAFGELLPAKPSWLEQDEYEQQHGMRFALERIGKHVCFAPEIIQVTNPDYERAKDTDGPAE